MLLTGCCVAGRGTLAAVRCVLCNMVHVCSADAAGRIAGRLAPSDFHATPCTLAAVALPVGSSPLLCLVPQVPSTVAPPHAAVLAARLRPLPTLRRDAFTH